MKIEMATGTSEEDREPIPEANGRRAAAGRAARALALLLPLALAACGGGGGSTTSERSISEEDEDYPNLARVPDQPPQATPASLREQLVEGLVADRANAHYTGELLTPQMAAPPPAAPPPAAKTQVEIRWDTLRVVPEEEDPASEAPASEAPESEALESEAPLSDSQGDQVSELETEAGAAALAVSADAGDAADAGESVEEVQVEWDTERVEPSGKLSMAGEDESKSQLLLAPDPSESVQTAAAPAAATAQTASAGSDDSVEINWDTDRVDPSGKVTMAGTESMDGELLLSPQPELVAIIYFPRDSVLVDQDDRQVLEGVMALHAQRGGRIHLIGHSGAETGADDQVAQRMASLDLSLQRANAVATTLVDLGATHDEVLVEAKADREPAAGESSELGDSTSRRVEIFLEY